MNKNKTPVWLKIGRIVLPVLLCLLLIATIASVFLNAIVYEEEVYTTAVCTDSFQDALYSYLRTGMEDECLFYDLPFSILDKGLDGEDIAAVTEEYTKAVYGSLKSGEKKEFPTLSPDPLEREINAYFASGEAEEGLGNSSDSRIIAEEMSKTASAMLYAGVSDTFLDVGHRVFGISILIKFASLMPILIGVTVLFLVLSLLSGIGDFPRQAYRTFGGLTIGASLVFVPVWLLCRYDLPSRLVLGDSPLKLYVNTIFYAITDKMFTVSLWMLVITAILLIASVVWVVLSGKHSVTETASVPSDE